MTSSTTRTTARSRRPGIRVIAGVALLVVLLAGCAASANEAADSANDAGFWLGLWQGFIAPIAFIVSLFNDSVGIYEVDNNGAWYDFGYIFGISIFFSGSGAGAGSRSRRR
ncbi:hypothetical protein GA707_11835 [Nostocoides sp. F2B08]|uniref:hypothetical protein n=1 Tax=Nostocoides sp. F2B08 TaxID=2653936 RepID=UPI001263C007|nr:hypothetical protein [Tetrasphaera sp. F2B08]KAB7744132.1 hypothetical protein GA707_11835 [Tetrasphaera sp. F2B08]